MVYAHAVEQKAGAVVTVHVEHDQQRVHALYRRVAVKDPAGDLHVHRQVVSVLLDRVAVDVQVGVGDVACAVGVSTHIRPVREVAVDGDGLLGARDHDHHGAHQHQHHDQDEGHRQGSCPVAPRGYYHPGRQEALPVVKVVDPLPVHQALPGSHVGGGSQPAASTTVDEAGTVHHAGAVGKALAVHHTGAVHHASAVGQALAVHHTTAVDHTGTVGQAGAVGHASAVGHAAAVGKAHPVDHATAVGHASAIGEPGPVHHPLR